MDLKTFQDFNTNDDNYKLCKEVITEYGLLEKVRTSIDYSVLLDNIKDIDNIEEQWRVYGALVVNNCRNDFIACADTMMNKYNLERDYVQKAIIYSVIYITFTGFQFELEAIKRLIKDGYTIVDDNTPITYKIGDKVINSTLKDYLDSVLAIDIRAISPKGELIGIQFKSETYLNLSFNEVDKYNNKIKEKHDKKHTKAVNNNLCTQVYFMFHKANTTDILALKEPKPYFNYNKGDYLIKSHHITTLNKFGKAYIKHYDFD